MPISNYNPLFGGQPGSAQKAKKAMATSYPTKRKADQVFYATANKRKNQGGNKQSKKSNGMQVGL
jgi:hypothetical protein